LIPLAPLKITTADTFSIETEIPSRIKETYSIKTAQNRGVSAMQDINSTQAVNKI